MLPSTGTVGDSYDNAMAESVNGAYKTELVWRRKPFQDLRDLELATFRWVSWWNSKRLHQSLGYRTPERTETEYYANQAAQAAPTIRAEQKSGHIRKQTTTIQLRQVCRTIPDTAPRHDSAGFVRWTQCNQAL